MNTPLNGTQSAWRLRRRHEIQSCLLLAATATVAVANVSTHPEGRRTPVLGPSIEGAAWARPPHVCGCVGNLASLRVAKSAVCVCVVGVRVCVCSVCGGVGSVQCSSACSRRHYQHHHQQQHITDHHHLDIMTLYYYDAAITPLPLLIMSAYIVIFRAIITLMPC